MKYFEIYFETTEANGYYLYVAAPNMEDAIVGLDPSDLNDPDDAKYLKSVTEISAGKFINGLADDTVGASTAKDRRALREYIEENIIGLDAIDLPHFFYQYMVAVLKCNGNRYVDKDIERAWKAMVASPKYGRYVQAAHYIDNARKGSGFKFHVKDYGTLNDPNIALFVDNTGVPYDDSFTSYDDLYSTVAAIYYGATKTPLISEDYVYQE